MFRRVHRTNPALFAPVGPVRALRRPLPPVVADTLLYAALVADVAVTLGVRHRLTGPAHAALLMWTLSYRNSWSMVCFTTTTTWCCTARCWAAPAPVTR
jgi:hypothetical protein